MLCPDCMTQCHQKDQRGGGKALDDFYETWMYLECPDCGQVFKEHYSVQKIYENQSGNLN